MQIFHSAQNRKVAISWTPLKKTKTGEVPTFGQGHPRLEKGVALWWIAETALWAFSVEADIKIKPKNKKKFARVYVYVCVCVH